MLDLEPLNAALKGKGLRMQVEQRRDALVVRGTFPGPDGGDVHEWQPREKFTLRKSFDHRQVLQAALVLGCLNQGEAQRCCTPGDRPQSRHRLLPAIAEGVHQRGRTGKWISRERERFRCVGTD